MGKGSGISQSGSRERVGESLTWPAGFRCGSASCGLKGQGRLDVAVLVADEAVPAAAVFTRNAVQAAPIIVSKEHMRASGGLVRAVVINSGNANACTGRAGLKDAERMCAVVSRYLKCPIEQVLVASTGVIGHRLDIARVAAGIEQALSDLRNDVDAFRRFAVAITTTDRWPKFTGREVRLGGDSCSVAGVAKGAGMICPNMATMLAFVATDAVCSPATLRSVLRQAVNRSFNRITVDGHTSTNDFVVLLASGRSRFSISGKTEAARQFSTALEEVCLKLAGEIVRDGEGATKVVRVVVEGAASDAAAEKVARAIANSPLVRTAMYGNDPNWGRIVSAAGYSGAVRDISKLKCRINGVTVFAGGLPRRFEEAALSRKMQAGTVEICVSLQDGDGRATVLTCDLTHDYVTLNAEYHT